MNKYLCSLAIALLVLAGPATTPAAADVISNWNEIALGRIANSGQMAIQASRALAMVHIAMYDTVNALDIKNEVFYVRATPLHPCSTNAAAAAAAYTVLRGLYTNSTAALYTAFTNSLAAEPDDTAKSNGVFLGQYVGDQVLVWRSNDMSMTTNMAPYIPGTNAGEWRPTYPDYRAAMMPNWAMTMPFAMTSSNQFRCPPPPALNSSAYAAYFDEVKVYSNNVAWTNAEQPKIVWFWVDMTGTVTTVGRWNRIAQYVGTNNDLQANARMYCLLNVALADAGISAWENKYNYNLWRPITAIREAADDGNLSTTADTNWVPYVTTTPNFPSYASAHSVFSAAAAATLSNFFGADSNAFTVQPYNMMATNRMYTSFSEAANEAAISRLWAGIHFTFDNTAGLNAGYDIGNYVSHNFLRTPSDFVPDTDGIDTDGDGNVSNDYVNIQLSAGDGFATGADGYDFYCFGFADMTGVRPEDVMMQGMLAAEFSAPTFHFKEGQRVYLRLSNVGMIMRPDLFDPHTVHFHGFPNAATIFDGEPMASIAINMGGTLTYYYQIVEPGTFMYHCHVEATEHMEMGMLGNCYVDPIQNNFTNGTILTSGFVHSNGFTYAYNDGDGSTRYDVAYPLQVGSFDRLFHERQITVQPLTFNELRGDYPLLNGRGYPDTINTGYITNMNGNASQKITSLITARQGQTILLRISNLDTIKFHTVTALGIPMKVIGQGARILRGPDPDGAGALHGSNLYYHTSSVTLGGGQSCDVLLDTAGVTPGTYLLYSTDLAELSNGTEDFGGMMTEIVIE